MGRNKALLHVDNVALWQRQYALLGEAGSAHRLVSVRAGDDWLPADVPRVLDSGEKGPFGGLLAALEASTTTHIIALAVDLPRLPLSWLLRLRSQCAPGRGAVGHNTAVNAFEPLAAIYPRQLLTLALEADARGAYCLQSLLARAIAEGLLHVEPITSADRPAFANWNHPSDVVET